MQDLIYHFVRGAEYREMLTYLIPSLRCAGAYHGDITVFCESMCDRMKALQARGDVDVRESPWMSAVPWALDRVACMHHIREPERYRTITLMDADMLALGPIAPMLERDQHILHQEEDWQVYGKLNPGHHQEMYIWAMSKEERAAIAQKHPINAGILTWPGSTHAELQQRWLARISRARDGWAKDQATLNAVLRFEMAGRCAVYHPGDIANATMTAPKDWHTYRLLHFAGHSGRMQIYRNWPREISL